jgi:hypothetical protein
VHDTDRLLPLTGRCLKGFGARTVIPVGVEGQLLTETAVRVRRIRRNRRLGAVGYWTAWAVVALVVVALLLGGLSSLAAAS